MQPFLNLPARLAESGFAILPNVLNAAEIAALEEVWQSAQLAQQPGMRHAMAKIPKLKDAIANLASLRSLIAPLFDSRPFLVRVLIFDKTASANWGVTWHQDTTIAVRDRVEMPGFHPWSMKEGIDHVRPPAAFLERMLTLRLHLDDTDGNNGCLWAIPGSHRLGFSNATQINTLKPQAIPLPVPKGGILMMKPLLLHASYKSQKPKQRRVIHLEFTAEELPEGLDWDCQMFF